MLYDIQHGLLLEFLPQHKLITVQFWNIIEKFLFPWMAWEALRHPSYLHVVTEQSLISGQNFLILDGFKKSELLNVPRQSAEFWLILRL